MGLSKYSLMNLPVGFRFQPTEEELITHYLRLKMIGKDSDVDDVIVEVDYLLWDPWELPDKSRIESDDQIWYFFCRRENSKWSQRTTKSGYWKITGRGRMIKARDTKACIGKKKIMVFHNHGGPIPGRGTNWVIHEYHLQPDHALPEQRPYVIYRLENKAAKKAGSPACEEGEPSNSNIVADVEDPIATPANSEGPHAIISLDNKTEDTPGCYKGEPSDGLISGASEQVAPTAFPNVHGHAEENADLPAEPLFSLDDGLTLEDLSPNLLDYHTEEGIFLDCINVDQQINTGMHMNHPTPENSLPQGPHAIISLDNKTEDTPGCYIGKPSEGIISGAGDQVAPTAILNVHGHAEENADLPAEPLFSLDDGLTLEDLSPNLLDYHTEEGIFLDCINVDQQINTGMHMNHPTPENSLPQGPHGISSLENITEDTPGCYIGEPSDGDISGTRDQVAPTAFANVHGQVDVNGDQNKMQASCGADESEELYGELWDELYESYCRETKTNLPNDSLQMTSLKRSHPPASVDTDVVGVGERSKRSRSLAPGELLL